MSAICFGSGGNGNPRDDAAMAFCREVRKISWWLRYQSYSARNWELARLRVLKIWESYLRKRGDGNGAEFIWMADRVAHKLVRILSIDLSCWNEYRRGQQFRRLDERLRKFERETARRNSKP